MRVDFITTKNENKMWVVETEEGIVYIGRDPAKDPKASSEAKKGQVRFINSKNLGYPVVFKNKEKAQKFASKVRRLKIAYRVDVIEVEFYKGEIEE